MNQNNLAFADSYKFCQYKIIPPNTQYLYSYIESRGGDLAKTLFFGANYIVKEYLTTPFSKYDIDEIEDLILEHGEPFNREGFDYIWNKYGGFWPVKIRAVKEGTVVPTRNLLMDIINTDIKAPWCTQFLESMLMEVWYPITVASREYEIKKLIYKYLVLTAEPAALDYIGVKHVDFGLRGASSRETAVIGGMAHLTCFTGTDNVPSLLGARKYYGAKKVAGYSIPASEHSNMTSWGDRPGELLSMRNILKQFAKPGAFVACVSDSYDLWNAIENYWGGELLEEVKKSGATVVVRPDSGDPVETPLRAVQLLMKKVGYTINSKGYAMLPPYFRVIQGDGIDLPVIKRILEAFEKAKISTDNIAFGMGGAMLQKVDRDTQKFAMKCSAIYDGDKWIDVFKDPITDPGKRSKKGRLDLICPNGQWETVPQFRPWGDKDQTYMETIFENGVLKRDQTLESIRGLVDEQVKAGV
jgi:nicotinamide phosphoribosyltransferase